MKWALVLSGGGAAGLAYIGFFKALEQMQLPKPDCIVGCSIGSVIGGLYAIGMPVSKMETIIQDSFDVQRYVGGIYVPFFKKTLNTIIQYGTLLTRMISGSGADSGEKVRKFFFELSEGKSFDDCSIRFLCNALDLCTGKEIVLNSGLLADAMRASSSYPGLFTPVVFGDALLIDACVIDNTPIRIARQFGYKNILALTFGHNEPLASSELDSSLAVMMRTLTCTSSHITLQKNDYPTAYISLINDRSAADFSAPHKQIAFGYEKTMEAQELLNVFFSEGIKGSVQRYFLTRRVRKEFRI